MGDSSRASTPSSNANTNTTASNTRPTTPKEERHQVIPPFFLKCFSLLFLYVCVGKRSGGIGEVEEYGKQKKREMEKSGKKR